MIFDETYTLSNGVKIPKLGLGTWCIPQEDTANAVRAAIEIGYRHIDTAQAYGNEEGVGTGVRGCGLPREQIFVTDKVAAEAKSYESAAASIDESLHKMGLDYIDLMIIRSPQPWAEWRQGNKRYFEENREVWRALEDAYQAGKLRAIGVSNFLQDDLDSLLASCRMKPMVNQILLHISSANLELAQYTQENGVLVEAYSPIAHGEALKNPDITAMAEKYGVSSAALCVRYVLELGAVALPKTANPVHMRDNAAVDFRIAPEDMETLKRLEPIQDYGEFSYFPVFSGK